MYERGRVNEKHDRIPAVAQAQATKLRSFRPIFHLGRYYWELYKKPTFFIIQPCPWLMMTRCHTKLFSCWDSDSKREMCYWLVPPPGVEDPHMSALIYNTYPLYIWMNRNGSWQYSESILFSGRNKEGVYRRRPAPLDFHSIYFHQTIFTQLFSAN